MTKPVTWVKFTKLSFHERPFKKHSNDVQIKKIYQYIMEIWAVEIVRFYFFTKR